MTKVQVTFVDKKDRPVINVHKHPIEYLLSCCPQLTREQAQRVADMSNAPGVRIYWWSLREWITRVINDDKKPPHGGGRRGL